MYRRCHRRSGFSALAYPGADATPAATGILRGRTRIVNANSEQSCEMPTVLIVLSWREDGHTMPGMKWVFNRRLLGLAVALALSCVSAAQEIVVTPGKAGGIYDVGAKIVWRVSWKGDKKAEVNYVLKQGGLTAMKSGTLDLSAGPAAGETALDQPGTVLGEFKAKVGEKEIKALAGTAAAAEENPPSPPPPADLERVLPAEIGQIARGAAQARI